MQDAPSARKSILFWHSHFHDSLEFEPPLPESEEAIRQRQQEKFEKWEINGPGSIEERDDVGVAISLQEGETRLRELEKTLPAPGCVFCLGEDVSCPSPIPGPFADAVRPKFPEPEERSPFISEEEELSESEVA